MERGTFEVVDTESLVPEGHLLHKIDETVDFNKIYDMVSYCTVQTMAVPAWILLSCSR